MEAFKDSLEYKQYEERLERIVTWEEHEDETSGDKAGSQDSRVARMIAVDMVYVQGGHRRDRFMRSARTIVDMLELRATESGRRTLKEKRTEMLRLWRKLMAMHAKRKGRHEESG